MIRQNNTDTKIIVVAKETLVLNYDLSSTNVLNSHQIRSGKHIYCNKRLLFTLLL